MPDNSDYFDFEEDIHDFDEEGFEARVWNLLVLINPGDEELALQQFNRWREHLSEDGQPLEADSDWLPALFTAIAWQSGFDVERDDLESLQSAVNELSARFNLQLDWGGDLDDEDFAEGLDGVQLMSTAFDRLREQLHAVERGCRQRRLHRRDGADPRRRRDAGAVLAAERGNPAGQRPVLSDGPIRRARPGGDDLGAAYGRYCALALAITALTRSRSVCREIARAPSAMACARSSAVTS